LSTDLDGIEKKKPATTSDIKRAYCRSMKDNVFAKSFNLMVNCLAKVAIFDEKVWC